MRIRFHRSKTHRLEATRLNGFWTIPIDNVHKSLGRVVPVDKFAGFLERCHELHFNPVIFTAVPEEARKDFYDGKAVWIYFSKTERMIVANLSEVFKNWKKKKP